MQTEHFLKSLKLAYSIEHLRNQCEVLYVNQSLIDAKLESLIEIFFGVVANDTSATNPNYTPEIKHLFYSYVGERVSALSHDSKYPLSENSQKGITDFLNALNNSLDEIEKEIDLNDISS